MSLNTKRKLWVFGDSNSAVESFTTDNNEFNYQVQFEKYTGKKLINFSELLANELNLELNNFGLHGADNYTILDFIGRNIDSINKEQDIVIINLTSPTRFRIATNEGTRLYSVSVNCTYPKSSLISPKTVEEILINRTNIGFVWEIINIKNLVTHSLPNIPVLIWSPFPELSSIPGIINIEKGATTYPDIEEELSTIKVETQGKVDDGHLGSTGNIGLAKLFNKILNERSKSKLDYILNIEK